MNEDELRAFLESASAGERGRGARPAGGTTPPEPGSAADAAPSPQLAPTEPIQVPPAASVPPASVPSATEPPAAEPSFDEIMGGGEPSLTPIVLPGPPVASPVFPSAAGARREPVESASAPAQPPAARPAAQLPPTAPLGAPAPRATGSPAPRTAQLPDLAAELGFGAGGAGGGYEPISVTGGERERRRALPWVIVAVVAVIAIIGAVFFVNTVRGGGSQTPEAEDTGTSEPTTPDTDAGTPTTPDTDEGGDATDPDAGEDDETTDTSDDGVPSVDVGHTFEMKISQWDTAVDVSGKLGGDINYVLEGENLILQDGLLATFPASCKAMRTGFGMTRTGTESFTVLRPAETCAEAPELYAEVWGLVAAMTESARKI